MSTRIYNYKNDKPDTRDIRLTDIHDIPTTFPKSIDLRNSGFMPAALDQGQLNSCTANSSSNSLRYLIKKEKEVDYQPSRLMIYYFSRLIENDLEFDSGASNRDTMKAIQQNGVCNENVWPYDISKFIVEPPSQDLIVAKLHTKNFIYYSVNCDLVSIKIALILGYPIIFGITVFDSYESSSVAQTGIVPFPDTSKESNLGGHSQLLISYDDDLQMMGVLNSWGNLWGDKGFCYIPYKYILDPEIGAIDLWCCKYYA